MLDRLTSMTVFVQTARYGSFAAAAEKLGMSPQMVAKHIEALEQRVATRLLNRTTRKQSLTVFGRLYLDRCQSVLAEVEAADSLVQSSHAKPQGRLRINAPVTFGRHELVPLVTRFLDRYPEIDVELTLSDRLIDPVEEGYEAVVRLGPLQKDLALVARPLQPYRLVACASPAYLLAHGTPQLPLDLINHECLGFAPWVSDLSRYWHFEQDGQVTEVPVRGRLHVNDWEALRAAARDGFGVLIGYERALASDLASGLLVRVLPAYEGPVRPIHLLYAADRQMTLKLRCFVDHLMEALG
ncbi:LysR family transcriptional regulator [Pseudomonas syringae]|uniref:LysR family transcriptional regulator n=1 Tax=Pseudomonas syringae TaxID=317 RepID=A0A1C7Z7L0_PSESX|nr:LysR family transcriptional regulator [Pseudomonas syringae]OCR26064.1 LysR family transcriptional regulator [Pseudomonas syringae]